MQAVAVDRVAGATLDIKNLVEKVCGDMIGSDRVSGLHARSMILTALTYAQSSGARFKPVTPTEEDYTEAVGAACETFMSTLKDKGFLP